MKLCKVTHFLSFNGYDWVSNFVETKQLTLYWTTNLLNRYAGGLKRPKTSATIPSALFTF